MVLGIIGGSIAGSLYVLAEYFQPEPKEISKTLRNVKVRDEATTAAASDGDTGAIAPVSAPADSGGGAGSRRAQ
jgi:hypothetical protein